MSSVTQAASPSAAMPPGANGSFVDESTLRDARSTRATRRSSPSSTHAWRVPNTTSHGWPANAMRPTTLWVVASMSPIVLGAIASRGGAPFPPSPVRTMPAVAAAATTMAAGQRAECDPTAPSAAVRQLAAQSGFARSGELAAARVAVVRRLRERLGDDVVEARGNARPHVAGARRRLVHVRVDRRDLALALERRLAR